MCTSSFPRVLIFSNYESEIRILDVFQASAHTVNIDSSTGGGNVCVCSKMYAKAIKKLFLAQLAAVFF